MDSNFWSMHTQWFSQTNKGKAEKDENNAALEVFQEYQLESHTQTQRHEQEMSSLDSMAHSNINACSVNNKQVFEKQPSVA